MMLGDLWRIFEDSDSSGLFLDHWNSCAFSGCNFAIMNSCVERKVNRRSVPGSASVSADRFIGSKALDPSLTRMRTFSARRFGHLHRAKINGRKKGLKECQRLTTEITRSPWSLPIFPSSHLPISPFRVVKKFEPHPENTTSKGRKSSGPISESDTNHGEGRTVLPAQLQRPHGAESSLG